MSEHGVIESTSTMLIDKAAFLLREDIIEKLSWPFYKAKRSDIAKQIVIAPKGTYESDYSPVRIPFTMLRDFVYGVKEITYDAGLQLNNDSIYIGCCLFTGANFNTIMSWIKETVIE